MTGPYNDENAKSQVEAPVSDKHVQLDNAIDSLQSVNCHLLQLIRRVEGNDGPDEPTGARPVSCLLDVLNDAPIRLREIEAQAHELIERLESHLYR